MRTGDESLGIPVLDPFFESKMPIEINEDIIRYVSLFDFRVERRLRTHTVKNKATRSPRV